ncbi:MAG: methylsterol oxidase [Cypionkella sp.]|uniref:sterol desaturase family protein n=1 Tax=Cypionkella sp. TaxID=2811411 RepID=UPI002610E035|nr:sterol desaturase family protein [Cypionkella sp.]MDB5657592.1 methylsterol oxidase [Cypionkella sp.]
MDDLNFGKRNKRGDWEPFERISAAPLFEVPTRPVAIAKWIFGWDGYLLPWNLFYGLVAVAVWLWATPSMATMQTLAPGWALFIFARNAAMISVTSGYLHLRLYIMKKQGGLFKYNAKWPSKSSDAFLFRDQNKDNMFWTFISGVPQWTLYEVLMLWAMANGYIATLDATAHPVMFAVIMFFIPMFRELHFFMVHRMIHWPPLYKYVHSLHHANVNPGPWSGIAMHPVEHLFYFSTVLIHAIVPSHPVHVIFNLVHAGLTPGQGHTGFDKIVNGKTVLNTHGHAHYLHHKYFEVNYADGALPLDRWFGSFHDGSPEADSAMEVRMAKRRATLNRKI